ncbi:alkaline phosphatase [Acidipila sp. EB88]|uniref:alkaline phosphatase D family protein n=1 Tax=Acidipila sp. EB88 TaxID=2305226 RepID=UPI0013158948|nr:alkaline phosphatase D family protein [Acidipila sp. EB88]
MRTAPDPPIPPANSPFQDAAFFAVDSARTAAEQSATFPQSVASGDPQPHGIVLWCRVDPTRQGGENPSLVAWQISRDATFAPGTIVTAGTASLEAARDHTVKLPIEHAALASYTGYFYRFVYNGIASRTGHFKTLPAADAEVSRITLGLVVCQDFGAGYYTALAHLAGEQVDYVLHLGDYIYETISSSEFQNNPARRVPPFPSGSTTIPVDVGDYRHLYQVYRGDPHQQAMHERFAYIQLWDDHEFANDCHQDFHPDANAAPSTAATPQPALRQAANQAWSEYGLAAVTFDPAKGWEESIQVYRKLAFGRLADLVITDERLYRDGPPCGANEYGERYFTLGCEALHDPARTMLGTVQRAWFLEQVTGSGATWKLWANEVMLMQLKATALYVNLDQWDGYPKERQHLLQTIGDAGVQNLVALTGDLHTFLAGYLKSNFDNPFGHAVGVELMVGSLTSANFEEEIRSEVHLPGAPVPAKGFHIPHDLLSPLIRTLNPHIKFWDSSTHGYALLAITPDELRCEFKAVSTIREPIAELRPLKTLRIPSGKAELLD